MFFVQEMKWLLLVTACMEVLPIWVFTTGQGVHGYTLDPVSFVHVLVVQKKMYTKQFCGPRALVNLFLLTKILEFLEEERFIQLMRETISTGMTPPSKLNA